jgi:hypothetical protein
METEKGRGQRRTATQASVNSMTDANRKNDRGKSLKLKIGTEQINKKTDEQYVRYQWRERGRCVNHSGCNIQKFSNYAG